MNINKKYRNTLIRMFLIENLGESMYNALYTKSANVENASIYKRLSLNEVGTADLILKELKNSGFSEPIISKFFLKVIAFIVFSVFPQKLLEILLKKTLKKKLFRTWYNIYYKYNECFWRSMLDHEILQYELLDL